MIEFALEPHTVAEIVLGGFAGTISWLYHLHIARFRSEVARLDKNLENETKELEKADDKAGIVVRQLVSELKEADKNSESKLEKAISEVNQVLEKKFNDVRQDLYGRLLDEANHRKEVLESLQKNASDFWAALNALKDRGTEFQLKMVESYHTKQEMSKMLDDKIGPVLMEMQHLRKQISSGMARRVED